MYWIVVVQVRVALPQFPLLSGSAIPGPAAQGNTSSGVVRPGLHSFMVEYREQMDSSYVPDPGGGDEGDPGSCK